MVPLIVSDCWVAETACIVTESIVGLWFVRVIAPSTAPDPCCTVTVRSPDGTEAGRGIDQVPSLWSVVVSRSE